MYGKVAKISEYELKFGTKEQKANIFICCKALNNGDTYVIYSKIGSENTGQLFYGLAHVNNNKIVVMEPKNGASEIIKEIVWKILNNDSLNNYKVLDIKNIEKIEIIADSSLNMKPEVVKKLLDITIPKKIEETKQNKTKGHGCLIFMIIIVILGTVGFIGYDKFNKKIGHGMELICEKNMANTKINAFVKRKVDILYNINDDVSKLTENTSYTFNNYDNYNNFREKGTYFEYVESSLEDTGIKWEDDTYTFRTIITQEQNFEYFIDKTKASIKGNIEEDKIIFENQDYTCLKQKREE